MKKKLQWSNMMIIMFVFFGLFFIPLFHYVQAQERTVTGTVTYNPKMNDCLKEDCSRELALYDNENDWRPPTVAVNILVKGTDRAVKTDRDGNYEISVPSSDASLVFLCIGFERVEIPIAGRTSVDVKLIPTPLPKIDRLVGLIQRAVENEVHLELDELANQANVNRYLARDIMWLVIGHRRMAQAYPGEYIPDYRFDD